MPYDSQQTLDFVNADRNNANRKNFPSEAEHSPARRTDPPTSSAAARGFPEREIDPLWGDRLIRRDRETANDKPYGRPDNPAGVDSYDPTTAREATDRAIQAADEHANPLWKAAFLESLQSVAMELPEFTSDEVWERIGTLQNPPTTGEKRAAGALVKLAVKAGIIAFKPDGFKQSRRASCHHSILRVYESRIYGQELTT